MEYVAQRHSHETNEPIANHATTLETRIELRTLWSAESETLALALSHQSRASMAVQGLRLKRNRSSQDSKTPPTHVELRGNTNVCPCIYYYLNTQLHTAVRLAQEHVTLRVLYGFFLRNFQTLCESTDNRPFYERWNKIPSSSNKIEEREENQKEPNSRNSEADRF